MSSKSAVCTRRHGPSEPAATWLWPAFRTARPLSVTRWPAPRSPGAVAGRPGRAGRRGLMVLFYTAGMFLNDLCDYAIDRLVSHSDRCPPVWSPVPRRRLRLSRSSESAVLCSGPRAGDVSQRARPDCRDRGLRSLAQDQPAQPAADGRCPCPGLHHRRACCRRDARPSASPLGGLLFAYIVGLTAIAKAEAGSGLAGFGRRRSWPCRPSLSSRRRQTPRAGCCSRSSSAGPSPTASLSTADRRSIGRAVGYLIAGVALLDALALAVVGSAIGVALALAALGLTLFLQRYIKGT